MQPKGFRLLRKFDVFLFAGEQTEVIRLRTDKTD
jgi:hypothetical protein